MNTLAHNGYIWDPKKGNKEKILCFGINQN
jgi:hypothetical protein